MKKKEEAEFQDLVNDLVKEYQPQSVVERVLTDEIAVCLWKIATAERWAVGNWWYESGGTTSRVRWMSLSSVPQKRKSLSFSLRPN